MIKLTISGAALMLLLLISNFLFGQKKIESNYYFIDNQIKFSLSPVLYDNLSINNFGEPLLKSSVTFGAEASILYYKNIINNFGINIGVGFGLVPYNVNYGFNAPENSIFPDLSVLGQQV